MSKKPSTYIIWSINYMNHYGYFENFTEEQTLSLKNMPFCLNEVIEI